MRPEKRKERKLNNRMESALVVSHMILRGESGVIHRKRASGSIAPDCCLKILDARFPKEQETSCAGMTEINPPHFA